MKFWEVAKNHYFVNVDNITFIDCSEEGEFDIGFVSGETQTIISKMPSKEFAQGIRTHLGVIGINEKEDEDIANSEELSKSEPAWRAVLGE
jgi:hypothetical protein